ncbi:MAG: hypothetical protein E7583_09515 [Ruminococcaceae bacterium]|nr:hypothetical protein [Oscillospiraceae bacterium]
MEYKLLPPVREDMTLKLEHFPSPFHAAVFRLWETVKADRIAFALDTDIGTVEKAAYDMGLPKQKYNPDWEKRGYITTIRNAWHILPYDQLLALLGWDEAKLAVILKEDDFLSHKLGFFKPYCEKVQPRELSSEEHEKLSELRKTCSVMCKNLFDGAKAFEFDYDSFPKDTDNEKNDSLRLVFSYCGLYANVLDEDISLSYPEKLFATYREAGVNAVWLHLALYRVVPFCLDEKYSEGYELRQERLRKICELAAKYDIKIFVYLNEPRCMPLGFFERYPEMQGRTDDLNAAMCLSDPRVLEYLRYGVKTLCKAVPGIGGFFTINMSENLTHCKSRNEGTECEKCKDIPKHIMISDIVRAIYEAATSVNPEIKIIAWTWAWDRSMTPEEMKLCIDRIPKEVIIQSNSETRLDFTIGGVSGKIGDYSMSLTGPGPLARSIWEYALEKGHDVCAKVQINNTWECSTLPYVPVFERIRDHMKALRDTGVKHLMMSWTLGGCPSINLQIASETLRDPSEEKYDAILRNAYGNEAESIKKAAAQFSEAYKEFPFDIGVVYKGPQNAGPSNLLYGETSGFNATMTCYAYDDLDSWRSIYPREIYIDQLKKLCEKWKEGLTYIEHLPQEHSFRQMAYGGYYIFRSCYLQSEFVDRRETADKAYLANIVKEEENIALAMYELMQRNSLIGYEAANHYYYNRTMMVEKVVVCRRILKKYPAL